MGKTGEFRTLRAMNVIAVWLEQFEQWLSLFNKLTLEQVEDINSSVYIIPSYYSAFFFFKQIMACDFIKPKYLKWSKSLRTVWVVRLCFLWSLLSQQTKRWLLTSMSHFTLVVSIVWLWYNLLTAKKPTKNCLGLHLHKYKGTWLRGSFWYMLHLFVGLLNTELIILSWKYIKIELKFFPSFTLNSIYFRKVLKNKKKKKTLVYHYINYNAKCVECLQCLYNG